MLSVFLSPFNGGFFWLDWLIGLIFHLTEGILSFTWYAISKNSFNNLSYTVLPLKCFHIWHWWLLSHLMKRLYGIKDGAEFTDLSLSKGRYFLFADICWHSELMIHFTKKKKKVKRIIDVITVHVAQFVALSNFLVDNMCLGHHKRYNQLI